MRCGGAKAGFPLERARLRGCRWGTTPVKGVPRGVARSQRLSCAAAEAGRSGTHAVSLLPPFLAFTAVEQCVAGEPRALECTHALVPSHCLQGKGWGVERPTDRRRFRGQATHSPSLPERLQARIHTQTHEKPMLRAAYARAFPTSEGLGSSGCGLLWVYSSLPCA